MRRPSTDECRAALDACAANEIETLLARFEADDRAGVRALAASRRRALTRAQEENDRLERLMERQRSLHEIGLAIVAGLDEVGRGALAGPVTAAAVVLDVSCVIANLDDSKRLRPPLRREVAERVRASARAVAVAHASPAEIDTLGIAEATRLAWTRAIDGLGLVVDHVLVDGNDGRIGRPSTAVVGGDASCACIAAASVVAKVERDDLMGALALEHPGYGLELNRGYGTAEHLHAIDTLGPSAIHRRSFAPCCQRPLF